MQTRKQFGIFAVICWATDRVCGYFADTAIQDYAKKFKEGESLLNDYSNYILFLLIGYLIAAFWYDIGKLIKGIYQPRLFNLIYFVAKYDAQGTGYEPLEAKIRFIKYLKNANIQIIVKGCVKQGQPKQYFSETIIKNKDYLADSEETITLAKLSKTPSNHSLWAGDKYHVIKGSKNIATLRVTSGRRKQDYKIFIDILYNSQLSYYFTEESDLWESMK